MENGNCQLLRLQKNNNTLRVDIGIHIQPRYQYQGDKGVHILGFDCYINEKGRLVVKLDEKLQRKAIKTIQEGTRRSAVQAAMAHFDSVRKPVISVPRTS